MSRPILALFPHPRVRDDELSSWPWFHQTQDLLELEYNREAESLWTSSLSSLHNPIHMPHFWAEVVRMRERYVDKLMDAYVHWRKTDISHQDLLRHFVDPVMQALPKPPHSTPSQAGSPLRLPSTPGTNGTRSEIRSPASSVSSVVPSIFSPVSTRSSPLTSTFSPLHKPTKVTFADELSTSPATPTIEIQSPSIHSQEDRIFGQQSSRAPSHTAHASTTPPSDKGTTPPPPPLSSAPASGPTQEKSTERSAFADAWLRYRPIIQTHLVPGGTYPIPADILYLEMQGDFQRRLDAIAKLREIEGRQHDAAPIIDEKRQPFRPLHRYPAPPPNGLPPASFEPGTEKRPRFPHSHPHTRHQQFHPTNPQPFESPVASPFGIEPPAHQKQNHPASHHQRKAHRTPPPKRLPTGAGKAFRPQPTDGIHSSASEAAWRFMANSRLQV